MAWEWMLTEDLAEFKAIVSGICIPVSLCQANMLFTERSHEPDVGLRSQSNARGSISDSSVPIAMHQILVVPRSFSVYPLKRGYSLTSAIVLLNVSKLTVLRAT